MRIEPLSPYDKLELSSYGSPIATREPSLLIDTL